VEEPSTTQLFEASGLASEFVNEKSTLVTRLEAVQGKFWTKIDQCRTPDELEVVKGRLDEFIKKSKHLYEELVRVHLLKANEILNGHDTVAPVRPLPPAKRPIVVPTKTWCKKRENFSKDVIAVLKGWLEDHIDHPYPKQREKEELAARTGKTFEQSEPKLLFPLTYSSAF